MGRKRVECIGVGTPLAMRGANVPRSPDVAGPREGTLPPPHDVDEGVDPIGHAPRARGTTPPPPARISREPGDNTTIWQELQS